MVGMALALILTVTLAMTLTLTVSLTVTLRVASTVTAAVAGTSGYTADIDMLTPVRLSLCCSGFTLDT